MRSCVYFWYQIYQLYQFNIINLQVIMANYEEEMEKKCACYGLILIKMQSIKRLWMLIAQWGWWLVGVEVMSCLVSPGVREYSPTATNGQLSLSHETELPTHWHNHQTTKHSTNNEFCVQIFSYKEGDNRLENYFWPQALSNWIIKI